MKAAIILAQTFCVVFERHLQLHISTPIPYPPPIQDVGVDIFTLGQYLQPTPTHLDVAEYVTPEKFEHWRKYGEEVRAGCGDQTWRRVRAAAVSCPREARGRGV